MFVYDPNTCRYINMDQNPTLNQQTPWDWQRFTTMPWIYPTTPYGPVCGHWIPQPMLAPVYDPNYIQTYPDNVQTHTNATNDNINTNPNANVNTGTMNTNNPNTTCTTTETRTQDTRNPMFQTPRVGMYGNTIDPRITPMTVPTVHPMMQPNFGQMPMCYYQPIYPMTQPVQTTPQQTWTPWNYAPNTGYMIWR
jgi:hypothetical protein